jgi:hypothetical protein
MKYPECDELSCHPDNHPSEPCCSDKVNKRMNAEWPPLDNPHTCKKNPYAGLAKAASKPANYIQETKAIRADMQKQINLEDNLNSVDWMSKYLRATKDHGEDAKRWAQRLEDIQLIYDKRLNDMQLENEKNLEQGYQEAFEMLQGQRKMIDQLQEELYNTKEMPPGLEKQLDSLEIQED